MQKQENMSYDQKSHSIEIYLEITKDEICIQENLTSYYKFYKGTQGNKTQ